MEIMPRIAQAAGKGLTIEVNMGTTLSGSLQLNEAQQVTDTPTYFSVDRDFDMKAKLFGLSQSFVVGGLVQYSGISYQTGATVRNGYHRMFGLRAGWRLKGPYELNYLTSLDFYPLSTVSVFSSIQSNLNGTLFRSISQTDLFGYGYRIREGVTRNFKVKLFGSNVVLKLGGSVGLLIENFSKRRDVVIRTNQTTKEAERSEVVVSGNFTGSMMDVTLTLGLEI